jgi:hypothetical protein
MGRSFTQARYEPPRANLDRGDVSCIMEEDNGLVLVSWVHTYPLHIDEDLFHHAEH